MTTTIDTVLEEFRRDARSNREMGDDFERLFKSFLKTDPQYKAQFSEVWLWTEWPGRNGQPDTGIDLVAQDYEGDYHAIQCKFYDPSHSLQKSDIDSFFTASGKEPFKYRMIVSTTDKWSKHAEEALKDQQIPTRRLFYRELEDSPIDWSQFSLSRPQDMKLREKHELRKHQKQALQDVEKGLAVADRGKLIMACGTGKTFTSLRIAEKLAKGNVLFLVPSLSLLSQTLREWTAQAQHLPLSFAVCSDSKVGKSTDEDIKVHDLAYPATTDATKLAGQLKAADQLKKAIPTEGMTVVFSTYHSIQVIADAQKLGAPEFDLIICDEAHRTTGVALAGKEKSHFIKVHDTDFIKAKKRLYMTATPRIYEDAAKTQASENDAETLYVKIMLSCEQAGQEIVETLIFADRL